MRLGVICSAGGSAFFNAYQILRDADILDADAVTLVTDRDCGAETAAIENGIEYKRLVERDNDHFSRSAATEFKAAGCDLVLLYFTRLVTPSLHQQLTCLNIHPSILPAFQGFGSLSRAHEGLVRLLGATLHRITDAVDGGPILAQVASPVSPSSDLTQYERISFAQKVYLTLVAVDLAKLGVLQLSASPRAGSLRLTSSASPALQSDDLIERFQAFLSDRPDAIIIP